MKIKKYGFVLLMICLIVCTILLSVKNEQKRLSEKMALQEKEQLEEVVIQAEEELVTIEADAMIGPEGSESAKEDETIEETILVNDKYFKVIEIIDAEEWKYVYTIYNTDGQEVKKGESYRDPGIFYVDQETIEISINAGSYVNYCTYYDITNDRFSEQYESPIAADYHRVALLPYNRDGERPLIIKDMFDEGICYQEFSLDFADAIWPVVSAEFKDEDTLLITYNSGESYHYIEKTKLLYWGDSEIQTEEEEIPVCDMVRAMDFTAREPRLDITPEENRAYLEGYLKVLKNEIPAIGEVEVKYYKDLWRAGIEFEQLLKEKDTREYPYLYFYDDLDGDGKPEFAINQGCMVLFKYEKERQECRILYQTESCYFESIVGTGQIWYRDVLHADIERDHYIGLGEDSSFQDILCLEKGINPKHPFYKVGIGDDPTYYEDVSEEEWNELTKPFFEMVENHAVQRKTLEEVFEDLLAENAK